MKANQFKKGDILSETSFCTIKEVRQKDIVVVDDFGRELTLSNGYVEQVMQSADIYDKEEPRNMTDLAEIFINTPRIAQTVCFITKDNPKTKKDYDAEVKIAVQEVIDAKVSDVPVLLKKLIENPVLKIIPGSERIIRGRHYGKEDNMGRISFIDMEIPKDQSKDYDNRIRHVDPRTIQWIIVNKVKYTLKK